MKKAIDDGEMAQEIDFSNAVRGKYAGRIANGATMVLLDPDIIEVFPDSESVNAALRMVLRAGVLAAGESIGGAVHEGQTSK
jgi:hypothetical protein